jgi:hypothetical protein
VTVTTLPVIGSAAMAGIAAEHRDGGEESHG